MNKYLCIHGHFYQPPRENPWLEAIETQGSAKPYHDWNERISEECYTPNSAARILNEQGQITAITNNYEKISFNFGPTLLSWIKEKNPQLCQSLYEADKLSQQRFGGHGNALAQAYNHMILPLANARDKYTQLYWGIKDFEHHFQRKPEGLWLPETAVDLETLDMMSALGIKFTVLAPNQVKQVKSLQDSEWHEEFSIGTPYVQHLPSGRQIALFFYDGEVAKAVAFEQLLTQGEQFAQRLLANFPVQYSENTLMHIATDGETYGHHHAHGDMGLAYALNYIEAQEDIQLTNYAQFLAIQAPEFAVEIHENSSWSCAHGIERWRSNCGCNSGGTRWQQEWRGPLRDALDWLRDELIPLFEQQLGALVQDPWAARNEYIEVINDRDNLDSFLNKQAKKSLNDEERRTVVKWMELQRHGMLMYTSCGWFFDELSGIETVQVIKYAARVIQLAKELLNVDYEAQFLEKLALAPSNIAEYENGAKLYQLFVKPQCIDLFNVSAHLAASLPFTTYEEEAHIYSYKAQLQNTRSAVAGKEQLITGNFVVQSQITADELAVWYAIFYQGDQNLICAIKVPEDTLIAIENQLHDAFSKGDNFAVVKLFENNFASTLSLRDLFYDMKLSISQEILAASMIDLENSYQQFFENNAPLINFIADLNIELPQVIHGTLNSLINRDILVNLSVDMPNIESLTALFVQAKKFNITLDCESIAYVTNNLIKNNAQMLEQKINDEEFITNLIQLINFIKTMPIVANLWHLQNRIYKLMLTQQYANHELFHELARQLDLEVS